MIGFIGLGAAGGNIADEACKADYPAIAINYSQKDLDSLEYVEQTLKLVGSEGVGKNREEAMRLMEKNWESVVAFVKENFSTPSIEVIFVCFSTSGGSGSGMAPFLLEVLMGEMPEKTFVAVPILPDLSEVIVNQMNCIQTSSELSRLNLAVFPIDNEQVRKKIPTGGKNKVYKETNETFIKLVDNLIGYTEKQSKHGVLDKRDLLTIFNTKGVGTIATAKVTKMKDGQIDITEKGVSRAVHESWDESIFVPVQTNRIVRAGVVLDGQEPLMEFINFQQIFKPFESGMPLDLFEGYYHEDSGEIYTILAGLAWYNERLKSIEKIVSEKQAATERLLAENEEYEAATVNSLSSKIRVQSASKDKKKRSVSDMLKKYRK